MQLSVNVLATQKTMLLVWDSATAQLKGDVDLVANLEAMARACQRDGYVSLEWLGTYPLKGNPLQDAQALQWLLATLGMQSTELPALPAQSVNDPDDVAVVY